MVCKLNDIFFCLLHQSYDKDEHLQTLLPRLALKYSASQRDKVRDLWHN